jgi:hypothetical protein
MRTLLSLCLVAAAAFSARCSAGAQAPAVRQVRPAEVTPGALLILSGERLDRVATLAIGGQLASDLTVVNAGIVTAVTPPRLAPGPQPLELRATDGRTVYGAVTVAAPPTAPQPAAQPAPQLQVTSPPPTPSPFPPTIAPSPPRAPATPPARGRDDDDDDDKPDKKPGERRPPGRGQGR